MKWVAVALLVTLALLAATGCSGPPRPPRQSTAKLPGAGAHAESVAAKYGLTLGRHKGTSHETIPASLDEAQWAVLQPALLANGYDLRPYAGNRLAFDGYDIRERYEGHRASLHVITSGDELAGAYVVVDDLVPGVLSMREFGHPGD